MESFYLYDYLIKKMEDKNLTRIELMQIISLF